MEMGSQGKLTKEKPYCQALSLTERQLQWIIQKQLRKIPKAKAGPVGMITQVHPHINMQTYMNTQHIQRHMKIKIKRITAATSGVSGQQWRKSPGLHITVVGEGDDLGFWQGSRRETRRRTLFSHLGQAPADTGASFPWMLAGRSCLLLEGSVGDAGLWLKSFN